MVSTVRLSLALLLVADCARADLLLTPTISEWELEGVKLRQLVFADNTRRVTYTPPRGWHYRGGATHFSMQPDEANAQAEIDVLGPPDYQIFDESAMKRLCEIVLGSVPAQATRVTLVSQEKNPVRIENKETFLIVINYEWHGTTYSRSVMFLSRKTDQLRFQLTAPSWSFAKLQKEFLTSHFSWQNL